MSSAPTVLITRPQNATEALARTLDRLGYKPVIQPLLIIHPTGLPQPFGDFDAVILTSGNALESLPTPTININDLSMKQEPWCSLPLEGRDREGGDKLGKQILESKTQPPASPPPPCPSPQGGGDGNFIHRSELLALDMTLPCFCVGENTAEKARALGFQKIYSARGDGAELARLVHSTLKSPAKTILHISGTHTDSKAQTELQRLSYNVIAWPVYEAQPATTLTQETIDLLKQNKLDAILIFSTRTAETLLTLLKKHRLESCCKNLTVIGLSQSILDGLKQLPWRQAAASPVPTEKAILACLKKIHPSSKSKIKVKTRKI